MNISLYRGISLDPTELTKVRDRILDQGITEEPHVIRYIGLRHVKLPDVMTLCINDVELREDVNSWSFGCGDREGASFYAYRNPPKMPVLLRLSVDIKSVHVDGRDFLNTAFGFCEVGDKQRKEDVIKSLFGKAVLPYLKRAQESDSHKDRQKLAEAASIDERVIRAHLANRIPIFGRYRTRFCSAFAVQLPILARSITLDTVCQPWGDDVSHVHVGEFGRQLIALSREARLASRF
jgi:hypothetical protein